MSLKTKPGSLASQGRPGIRYCKSTFFNEKSKEKVKTKGV